MGKELKMLLYRDIKYGHVSIIFTFIYMYACKIHWETELIWDLVSFYSRKNQTVKSICEFVTYSAFHSEYN